MDWTQFAYGIVGGAVVAGIGYYEAYQAGETFDPYKFGATLVVGAAIGGYQAISGSFDPTNVTASVAADAGIVFALESVIKNIWGPQGAASKPPVAPAPAAAPAPSAPATPA